MTEDRSTFSAWCVILNKFDRYSIDLGISP